MMDAISREHTPGEGHPERPARFDAVAKALNEGGHAGAMLRIESRAVTDDEVLTCHAAAYLQMVERDIAIGHRMLSTGDTEIGPRSLEFARRAAGGGLNAVDALFTGKAANAFCVVRRPVITPRRGGAWVSAFSTTSPLPRVTRRKNMASSAC